MTPDPVGDWLIGSFTVHVTLRSGDTGPTPTLELRTSVLGSGNNVTVSFLFDFDTDVTSGSISSSSGGFSFGANPSLSTAGGNSVLEFNCNGPPCNADMLLGFATKPTTLDITDSVNQFIDSPGAPFQVLSASFGVVPIPAAVWLFGSALGLLGWIRRKAT